MKTDLRVQTLSSQRAPCAHDTFGRSMNSRCRGSGCCCVDSVVMRGEIQSVCFRCCDILVYSSKQPTLGWICHMSNPWNSHFSQPSETIVKNIDYPKRWVFASLQQESNLCVLYALVAGWKAGGTFSLVLTTKPECGQAYIQSILNRGYLWVTFTAISLPSSTWVGQTERRSLPKSKPFISIHNISSL